MGFVDDEEDDEVVELGDAFDEAGVFWLDDEEDEVDMVVWGIVKGAESIWLCWWLYFFCDGVRKFVTLLTFFLKLSIVNFLLLTFVPIAKGFNLKSFFD